MPVVPQLPAPVGSGRNPNSAPDAKYEGPGAVGSGCKGETVMALARQWISAVCARVFDVLQHGTFGKFNGRLEVAFLWI